MKNSDEKTTRYIGSGRGWSKGEMDKTGLFHQVSFPFAERSPRSCNMHAGRNKEVWNEKQRQNKTTFVSHGTSLRSCCGPTRRRGRPTTPLEQTWFRPRPTRWSASALSC